MALSKFKDRSKPNSKLEESISETRGEMFKTEANQIQRWKSPLQKLRGEML